jgi:hypothetical protein
MNELVHLDCGRSMERLTTRNSSIFIMVKLLFQKHNKINVRFDITQILVIIG